MMSPAGSCPYNEATWDPYIAKDPNYPEKEFMDKAKIDKIMKKLKNRTHPLIEL